MKNLVLLILLVIGFSSFSQNLTYTYDISALAATKTEDIINTPKLQGWSVTVVATSLTGTLDGQIDFYYSPNGTDTILIQNASLPFTLDSTNENFAVEKSTMNFNGLTWKITKNNLTGGTLTFYVNRKKY